MRKSKITSRCGANREEHEVEIDLPETVDEVRTLLTDSQIIKGAEFILRMKARGEHIKNCPVQQEYRKEQDKAWAALALIDALVKNNERRKVE